MNKMNEARFALILEGDALPMEQYEAMLSLKPTKLVRKGELLNRLPEIRAEHDEWVHAIRLTNPLGRDTELDTLLAHLGQHKQQLNEIAQTARVALRLHVQSDYAHMTYNLAPETLALLQAINMALEISSLSWGETGL